MGSICCGLLGWPDWTGPEDGCGRVCVGVCTCCVVVDVDVKGACTGGVVVDVDGVCVDCWLDTVGFGAGLAGSVALI